MGLGVGPPERRCGDRVGELVVYRTRSRGMIVWLSTVSEEELLYFVDFLLRCWPNWFLLLYTRLLASWSRIHFFSDWYVECCGLCVGLWASPNALIVFGLVRTGKSYSHTGEKKNVQRLLCFFFLVFA